MPARTPTQRDRDTAHDRARIITGADGLTGAALALYAREQGVGVSSLRRWMAAVAGLPRGDWQRVLCKAAPAAAPANKTTMPARYWNLYKAAYLTLEARTAADCYREVQQLAAKAGVTLPSESTFRRRLTEEISAADISYARDGRVATLNAIVPAQRRSVEGIRAGEAITGDGYTHNRFVHDANGEIFRPHSWVWMDVRSRKITAWRTAQTENKDTLRLAFLDHCRANGIPRRVVIDNTRAASNKWMSGGLPNRRRFKIKEDEIRGVFSVLGVEVTWTQIDHDESGRARGRGQSKPIERHFREFDDFDKRAPGCYTGRSAAAKPANYGVNAQPFEQFTEEFAAWVQEYNARPNRRSHAAWGGSFADAWAANYDAQRIMQLSPEDEMVLLLEGELRRVGRDGIVTLASSGLGGVAPPNRYGAEWMRNHAGQKLVCRFDPEDLTNDLHIYDERGRYLGRAPMVADTGFFSTAGKREAARQRKRANRAMKDAVEAQRKVDDIHASRHTTTAQKALKRERTRQRAEPRQQQQTQAPAEAPRIEQASGTANHLLSYYQRKGATNETQQ